MNGSYQLFSFTENKDSEVKRLRAQVNLFFDKEFETYEKFGLKNGMKIIECGSGPGFLIKNIVRRLPECDATALEIDSFLVNVLKGNSIENNKKLFDVKHASIYNTEFPDNTFDFAITRLVIEHLQHPFDALRELYRILKPGGKLIIVSNDFAYHLLTYPVIPELSEMYKAYCQSRISEGGNPFIGRQIPTYLKKEKFSDVRFEIVSVHSDIVGDKALLQAENVNISISLVREGFLPKETLDSLAVNWYKMLKDPDHVIYRQLFVICGEKNLHLPERTENSERENLHKSENNLITEFSGLNTAEMENNIRLFLANQVKKVMDNEDLEIKDDEKLCNVDIDSIAATELSSILHTNFNVLISISDILQKFSINNIITIILEGSENKDSSVQETADEKEEYVNSKEPFCEISQIQEQFWILNKLYPENTAYNIPSAFEVKGNINMAALENAVNIIIERHEILKVSFYEEDDKIIQKVLEDDSTRYKIDVSFVDESFSHSSGLIHILDEVHKAFNLATWPLFRIKIFSFNNNISVLTFVFHHIIIDLQSRQVFAKELIGLYNSYLTGRIVNLAHPVSQYSDYSYWLKNWINSDDARKKINEWTDEIPHDQDILQIPADFSRPRVDNLEGKRKHFNLDVDTSSRITKFAEENNVNAFTVLLSVYSILLNRLSNQSKIIIGVPLTNRRDIKFAETFGCFVNIVPVLVDFNEIITGNEVVAKIRKSLLRASRKQEVPFLTINNLLRSIGKNSIFQSGFTFEQPMNLTLTDLEIQPLIIERNGAQLDLFLTMWKQEDEFNGYLEYSTSLFKEETILRFLENYIQAIVSFLENAGAPVSDLKIISDNEIRLISEFNNTDCDYEKHICLHQKFEIQVDKTPDAPALMTKYSTLTYRETDEHINRLANYFISKGVQPGDVIAICCERSIEMMIGILAILKSGACYLPLQKDNPSVMIDEIISDSVPKIILATKTSELNINNKSLIVFIENILETPLSQNSSRPCIHLKSNSLAYILYTSGSTGKPKGTLIEHRSVLNRIGWMQKNYPLNPVDVLLQKTPITFDVSVWELFWWFFNGSKLVLLNFNGEKDPSSIAEYIEKFDVTQIHFVPSMFSPFLYYLKQYNLSENLKKLRNIFLSGEALPPKLVSEFYHLGKITDLPSIVNLYGPTEATVDVSYYNCPKELSESDKIYIGKPIDNTNLYIVNHNMKVQPIGVKGELLITGVNLSRGYLNKTELTNKSFINFEKPDGKIVRAYKTGDVAVLCPVGEIEYIGRMDNQVKIRGMRIELGEIESKLLQHPDIMGAAVIVAFEGEHRAIIGYVSFKSEEFLTQKELIEYISARVPPYMVPEQFIIMDNIPLTSSGKLDRKALPEPSKEIKSDSIIKPGLGYEAELLKLWQDILKIQKISVTDNFYDVGGNSLLAIKLAMKINEHFNIPISVVSVFEHTNIREFSIYLAKFSDNKQDFSGQKPATAIEKRKNIIKKNRINLN